MLFAVYLCHMEKMSEKKRFSVVARAKSFAHAWRGLGIMIRTQQNAWIHIVAGLLALWFGYMFMISLTEWALVIFAIGLVITAEAFNTAMEIDIDLTSPNYHPYARDTKDVAAGAVLISSIIALIIGLIIFVPKILILFA